MKANILFVSLFIAILAIALKGIQDNPNLLIGGTELNGYGCVCHTTERDYDVDVWVEGPDTLYVGQMGLYRMYLAGGPAEAGGYNVAGRFGTMELVDTFSVRHNLATNELTQAFSLPFPSTEDTIFWEFGYTASGSSALDTIYSCGISLVWDTIPDPLDRWNFGPKFPLTILNVTSVKSDFHDQPIDFLLEQNYPNPFNPTTSIRYRIGNNLFVSISIYDILGNKLASMVNEMQPAGIYNIIFNGSDYPSGIYFYKIEAGDYKKTNKMLLVK